MRKTKLIVTTLIVAFVLIFSTIVSAYSVSMILSSSSKLKEGSTVTVDIKLSNVDAGEGIDSIVAELEYDKNVFEVLSESSISAGDGWTVNYAPSTNMMTLTKQSKTTSAETVATITFKVKAAISADSTTVTLKDITASGGRVQDNGTGDIDVQKASVAISKEVENTPASNPLNVTKSDSTKATKKIPQTGENDVLIIAMAVVLSVVVISYVRYSKYNKVIK